MINWIARWFNRSSATRAAAAPMATRSDAPAGIEGVAGGDTDALFFRWLAGHCGDDNLAGAGTGDPVLTPSEKLIVDELARLAEAPQAGADLVPRVPAVIPQLLRSLRDDSVAIAEMSRQLAQDVVLVAEAIREANSPYYRPSTPVKTIEAAIMLLGQNGLRMLLARVAFRPIIQNQSGCFAAQVAPHIWRQSEACALAASMLAPRMGANPFEAFLAGLLHQVGLIVAMRLVDQIHTGARLPRSDQFCAALLPSARLLSARIAALWDFPVTVSMAIEQAGQAAASPPASPPAPPLAHVLALAERVAMLRMLVDAGVLAADDARVQGLGAEGAACLEQLQQLQLRHEED